MNYRKLYEAEVKQTLPKNFDVHHIDGDRLNNDILNLVALPMWLHRYYHNYCNVLDYPFQRQLSSEFIGRGANSFLLKEIIRAVDIWEQCQKWVDYRNFRLGLYPYNLYNYSY